MGIVEEVEEKPGERHRNLGERVEEKRKWMTAREDPVGFVGI